MQRNGTTWADGRLEMHTGEGDIRDLGRIQTWQSRNTTDAFEGECAKVKRPDLGPIDDEYAGL